METRQRPTFDPLRELAENNGTEWLRGTITVDLALIPKVDRLKYAPKGVFQFNDLMDTNGCASRAPLNILEAKLTWFYHNGMHPALKDWLRKNGYVVFEDGMERIKLNDAFIEILSGTTPSGNSLKAPILAIYEHGVIPAAMLPLEDGMTWQQYMDKKRITQKMHDLAAEFQKRITINFEQVPSAEFVEAWGEDFLSSAGHGWPQPVDGVYPRTGATIQHAFATVSDEIDALDNYEPFVKRLAKNFTFFQWGYQLSITSQNPYPVETASLFETLRKFDLLKFFADAWKNLINAPYTTSTITIDHSAPAVPTLPQAPSAAETLLKVAQSYLGRDASPFNQAPSELACAESVSFLINEAFGDFPKQLSTIKLKAQLDADPRFALTDKWEDGCVIVSPTSGANVGHTGILVPEKRVASNNSLGTNKGKFTSNYSHLAWKNSFGRLGIYIYKPVSA